MMSSIFVSIAVLSLGVCSIEAAANDELTAKLKAVVVKCKAETGADGDLYQKFWTNNEVPGSKSENCFIACALKDTGAFREGKFHKEVFDEFSRQRWSAVEDVEKAMKIDALCIDRVKTDGNDDCTSAHNMIECIHDEAEKMGLKHNR